MESFIKITNQRSKEIFTKHENDENDIEIVKEWRRSIIENPKCVHDGIKLITYKEAFIYCECYKHFLEYLFFPRKFKRKPRKLSNETESDSFNESSPQNSPKKGKSSPIIPRKLSQLYINASPQISPRSNSSTPQVSPRSNTSTPQVSPRSNGGTPQISPRNNSGTPQVSPRSNNTSIQSPKKIERAPPKTLEKKLMGSSPIRIFFRNSVSKSQDIYTFEKENNNSPSQSINKSLELEETRNRQSSEVYDEIEIKPHRSEFYFVILDIVSKISKNFSLISKLLDIFHSTTLEDQHKKKFSSEISRYFSPLRDFSKLKKNIRNLKREQKKFIQDIAFNFEKKDFSKNLLALFGNYKHILLKASTVFEIVRFSSNESSILELYQKTSAPLSNFNLNFSDILYFSIEGLFYIYKKIVFF